MKEVEIKDISGKVRFSTPINKGAKGKFTLMKEDYIILPFSVAKPVAFKMGDYVDLSEVLDESLGGKLSKIYEIVDLQKPTYNSSTGGYDYELKLDAYYWKWKNKIFKYTPENAGSEASWTLTAGLDVQLGVFLRNLKALGYTYKGKDYVFEIDSTVENKAVAMTYDNINLLDALFSMAGEDKWNCDCWVEENVIHFGRNEFGDAVKIERDIEASSITRSESQGTYATRIYAFGGTRNIPNNYGKKFIDSVSFIQGNVRFTGLLNNTNYYLEDGADVQIRFLTGSEENKVFPVHWTAGNFYFEDGTICKAVVGDRFELLNFPDNVPDKYLSFSTEDLVVNGVVQKRLMMPADTPYIDVYPDMSQEEAVENIVVFDDIYPKRIGTMSDVNTVPRDIKEDDKVVGTFDAYQYKDAGLVFDKKYQIEGTELKITFQSGKMNGMEFGVIFDPNDKDEQLWEIVRNEDYGRPLPDEYIHPENGDQYVLSGFNIKLVSDQYIPSAEQELKERAQKYADKTKIDDGTYPVTLRSDWVKENLILRTFGFGQRINLIDDTFFENGRISRVLGWEMNLDIPWDSPVYTIGESMPYSRIEELEEKVDSLIYNGQTYNGNYGGGGSYVYVIKTNDSTSPTDSNVFSALRSLATFLRKDKADSTKYLITFLAGLLSDDIQSTDFSSGPFGTGYLIKRDPQTGKSYIEADEIYIRLKAYFDTLEIKHLSQVGGRIVLSPAGMECNRVEVLSGEYETLFDKSGSQLFDSRNDALSSTLEDGEKVYRCYFNDSDGEKEIVNEFEIDDFAQCREFNIKENVSQNVSNQYYWRRVVGVGSNYIDLSITDCDTGSMIPKAGDTIVTIGNKTNEKRQNVVLLSSYDDDAPYLKLYSGVNSYSMLGKEVTVISPNAENNVFTGRLVIKPGSEGFKNLADAPDMEVINQEINNAKEDAQNAINAANEAKSDVSDLNSYVDGAFADGIITEAEAKAIEKYINIVENTSQSAEKAYNELYNNVYLTGSAKVALGNSYSLLSSTIQSLISAIETAISDGKTTVGEKESVDKAYGEFNQAYSNFTKCVEDANKAIQDKLKTYSDNAQKAADEAQGAADKAQEDANDAKKAASDLNTYIDGAFADGIISEAEAKSIEKYINIVTQNKKDCDATYTVLYNNEFLVGTAKSNLRTAKNAFDLATSNLITAIQSAIADGKTTSAEKANVDSKYSTFYTNYASLSTAIEDANKSIQERIKKLAVEEAAENAIEEANKVSEAAKNEMAVNMGYSNYEALESAAKRGETVVQGGMINTKLINAMAIVTSQLIANAIKTNTLNVNNKFIINTDGSVVTEGQHTSRGTKTVMTIDNGYLRVTYNGNEVARLSVNQETGLPTLVLTYGNQIASFAPNMLSFTGSNGSLRIDPTILGSGIIKKNTDGILYIEEKQYNYITISVNVSPAGAGRTYPYEGSALVLSGSSESVQAIANEGYEFERWSDGGEQTHNVIWSSGMKLTAYFREKDKPKYVVFTLANPSSGGTVSGGGTYEEGTIRTVTASANEGYRFVRWSDGGAQSHSVKWDENKVLTAYFEAYSIDTQEILTADILDLSKWNITGDSEVSTYNVGSTKNVMLNFGSGSSISFSKGLLLGKIKAGHRYELTINFITTSDAGWYIVVGTDSKLLDTSWVGGLSEDTKGEYKQIKINAIATRNSNINDALWFLGGDVIFIKSLSLKEIEI